MCMCMRMCMCMCMCMCMLAQAGYHVDQACMRGCILEYTHSHSQAGCHVDQRLRSEAADVMDMGCTLLKLLTPTGALREQAKRAGGCICGCICGCM